MSRSFAAFVVQIGDIYKQLNANYVRFMNASAAGECNLPDQQSHVPPYFYC